MDKCKSNEYNIEVLGTIREQKRAILMTDVSAVLKNTKHLHFVGIGGSGMFPLVEVMRKEGYTITGSDVLEGSIIDAERAMGIDVHIGHDARLVEGADAVVVTAALLAGNP